MIRLLNIILIIVAPVLTHQDLNFNLRNSDVSNDKVEKMTSLDQISSKISDKDLDLLDPILDMIPDIPLEKIHIHHIFPPSLIRPLQKVIVRKIIRFLRNPPTKKFKRKMKRISRAGTVALGIGIAHDAVKEITKHPTTAQYKVTGLVDLSGQKHYKDDEDYKYKDLKQDKYQERSDDQDSDDPDYKSEKDYKLMSPSITVEKHIHWPFHESKDEIYEKWNKFPDPSYPNPYSHKIKHIHKTFHEIHPDLLHIIKDVHGLVGTKTVIHSGPELENPIVLAGQLIKLLDSLVPSIRIRIPFIEYLIRSFHKKSKPKVVYVKQPPTIKYVSLPYKEDTEIPESVGMAAPKPLEIKVPITVKVPEVEMVPQPVHYKDEADDQRRQAYSPQMSNKNYEVLTRGQLAEPETLPNRFNSRPNYDRPQHPSYTKVFESAVNLYKDKSRAGTRARARA